MIDALVFSRDRPMQLDACLRSLMRNVDVGKVAVLYQATSEAFAAGYMQLERETRASLIHQDTFSLDALAIIDRLAPHILMLCDDAITFGPAEDPDYAMREDVLCMSLRLGRNTTYCHPRDLHHGIPPFTERGCYLTWDWHGDTPDGDLFEWQGREGDFGYPYSLDGVVHRRTSLLQWLDGASFTNPNQMEGCVVHAIGQRRDLPPLMACYPESVQVGLPINVVNTTHGNRFGLVHPVETAALNDRFLAGGRIDLDAMEFTGVRGAHQEIELRFT